MLKEGNTIESLEAAVTDMHIAAYESMTHVRGMARCALLAMETPGVSIECIAGVLEAIISSVDIAKNSVDYVAGEAGVNTLDPHWLRRIDAREKERELARGAA
jgi:hypothetical protein